MLWGLDDVTSKSVQVGYEATLPGLWPRSWFFRARARPLLQVTETFILQEVLELAFSILYDPDETLNFIAPNKYEVSRVGLPRTSEPSLGGAGRIAMSP